MITHLMLHELDAQRTACVHCGTPLPKGLLFDAGVRMGKVVTEHGGTRTWPAGETEQTPRCTAPAPTAPKSTAQPDGLGAPQQTSQG